MSVSLLFTWGAAYSCKKIAVVEYIIGCALKTIESCRWALRIWPKSEPSSRFGLSRFTQPKEIHRMEHLVNAVIIFGWGIACQL